METLDNNLGSVGNELELRTRDYLTTAGKWGRFLAILGFIGCGLIVILGLVSLAMSRSNNGIWSVLMTVAITIIYFLPSLYLFRFSAAAIETGQTGSSADLEESMLNLKKFLKYLGILIIVMISIYTMIIAGAFLFASSMRF